MNAQPIKVTQEREIVVVVVVGPNSTNIDSRLRALGLVPLSDNGGNATVWLPVDKTEEATNKARRASEQQPRTPPNNRILLTIKEAASALGVGRSTVYGLISRGDLEVVHIGRATRVRPAALEELVKELRGCGKPRLQFLSAGAGKLAGTSAGNAPKPVRTLGEST